MTGEPGVHDEPKLEKCTSRQAHEQHTAQALARLNSKQAPVKCNPRLGRRENVQEDRYDRRWSCVALAAEEKSSITGSGERR